MRRNIMKDTVLLTAVQMALDALALAVNVLLTARLGADGMGVLTLAASFFRLACMIAGGNVFLCVSRFVSEELGKPQRDPAGVLRYCLGVSLGLSGVCAVLLSLSAPRAAAYFLHSAELAAPIRRIALVLPLLTVTACIKGWFNALCRAGICAAADVLEFLLRAGLTFLGAYLTGLPSPAALCDLTVNASAGAAAGELLFLLCCLPRARAGRTGRTSIGLRTYLRLAIPVMAGSALTSLLSAANDALVPVTLRQSGRSPEEALAQFGIFEAMILPTLFFPSTILVSLAGILVTETAREQAAARTQRIRQLTEKTIRQTLQFAVFVTMLLLLFGDEIGMLLGGGETAGTMIRLLAPVVPFIYLEIVLESIIKGLGMQAFSSLNYLCEYIIRISAVLICIPLTGFYGIVISYYLSNIAGNTARLVVVFRKTGLPFRPLHLLGMPVFAAVCAVQMSRAAFLLLRAEPGGSIPAMLLFGGLCAAVYLLMMRLPDKERPPVQAE